MTSNPKTERLDAMVPVRFTTNDHLHLQALAATYSCSVSDLIRDAVQRAIRPIGWVCDHMTSTSSAGTLILRECTAGCQPAPVYATTGR